MNEIVEAADVSEIILYNYHRTYSSHKKFSISLSAAARVWLSKSNSVSAITMEMSATEGHVSEWEGTMYPMSQSKILLTKACNNHGTAFTYYRGDSGQFDY